METTVSTSNEKTLNDHIAVIKRRKRGLISTFFIVLMLGLLATLLWPPTYRSTAVILIEGQDVPQDFVRTTITSFAVQRIQEIKQRIMTTGNIMSIVERFKLYTDDELKRLTRNEIAIDFRSNVSIQPISADVIDPKSGRPTQAIIAFSLSFDGRKIGTVHKVTNELVTLYLSENLKDRTNQSSSTSEFLSSEAEALNAQLKSLESEISIFKEAHKGSLPELTSFNLSVVDRSQRELLDIVTRRQDLERRKLEIEAKLSQLSPNAPQVLPNGETVLSEYDRLKALRSEYRRMSALYHEKHPDVQKLKREIESLDKPTYTKQSKTDIANELLRESDRLKQYEDQYTEEHPLYLKQVQIVEQLKKEFTQAKVKSEIKPDNPSYVLIETQQKSISSEINSLTEKENTLRKKIIEYETLLEKTPEVEKNYRRLLRDYDNTQAKYQEIKAKQMAAELANNLEEERKGERFTLIQPPEIPESPVSPNRILLSVITLILAIGSAVSIAGLLEVIDTRVYGEEAISAATGLTPIVSIPYMKNRNDNVQQKRIIFGLVILFIIGVTLCLVAFHFFVKPLDVTWFILLRKLGVN